MPFYVYGRDASSGEVLRRYLSEAPTEADARAEGVARGMHVTEVIARPNLQVQAAEPTLPVSYSAQEESDEFERRLETSTPTAWVTYIVIAANLIVFAAMVYYADGRFTRDIPDLLRWGADYGPLTTQGEWWRMLTNLFVHMGLIHLLANMVAFGYVGRTVERMLGNSAFLLTYIIAGIGGSLASLFWNPLMVSAGASGAIFGVYGALLGVLLRERGGWIPRQVFDQLKWFAIVFVVYNTIGALGRSNIDMAAHIGGAICGFLCGLFFAEPLTLHPEGRLRKGLVAAGVSLSLFGAVAGVLHVSYGNLGEIATTVEQIVALDDKDAGALKKAAAGVKHGDLAQADVGALIEKDVLPEWRSAKTRLGALAPYPFSIKRRLERLARYMQLREAEWEHAVGTSRAQNEAAS
ncbi:MAG: rhomboid family intramembrane serine protease [Rudaea sp.]